MMSNWIKAIELSDIPTLGARIVQTDDANIAVFRTADDEVFALKNECPHRQGPLSEGIVAGASVTCPLHNWKIDLSTGQAMGADEGCTDNYETKIEGGAVYLLV